MTVLKELFKTKKRLKGLKTVKDIFKRKYKSTIYNAQTPMKKYGGQSKSDTPRSKTNKQMKNINITLFEKL